MTSPPDPFGTAELRRAVLAGWAASAARFREDANAEEELALGAYRDRLVVELAQNAADAATRSGGPGRLRLTLTSTHLNAANTGAPLDAAGVQALSTLRASAKRDQPTVGRFGVGFAAVRSVADQVVLASRTGGIRFDAADAAGEIEAIPELTEELARRRGHAPALRLPWPAPADPPDGFDTEVRLTLRPGAQAAVRAALADLSAELLLALPGLDHVELAVDPVDGTHPERRTLRVVERSDTTVEVADARGDGEPELRTWRYVERDGTHSPRLLADRPVEEQNRPQWSVLVAVRVDQDGHPLPPPDAPVVHAPTPTDEPLSLPARVIASYPLASDRRRVAPGPVRDAITGEVATAYAELVAALPTDPSVLNLAPRPGLAAGELDAEIRAAVGAALAATAWLPEVGAARRRRPGELRAVDGADAAVLDLAGEVTSGLLPASWSDPRLAGVLGGLGVSRWGIAELADELSRVDRPPDWWHRLYAALDAVVPAIPAERLAGLPVPLADGRLVVGARGLLRPGEAALPSGLDVLGLRVVDPAAAHPLLDRLGAQPSTVAAMLADDRVRAAVDDSIDSDDPEPIATAVLALVAAAEADVPAWLGRLALPGDDGRRYPADELVLPDSPIDPILGPAAGPDAPLAAVERDVLDRYGARALTAVGVLAGFAVVTAEPEDLDVDGAEEWFDEVLARLPDGVAPVGGTVRAVADLDLIPEDSWPAALNLLAGPDLRAAVLDPPWPGAPSYTRWWLARHPVLGGQRPDRLRAPDATELTGLYDVAPGDPELARLAGVRTGLADVLASTDGALDLLDRLGDPDRTVPAGVLSRVYARLATALDGVDLAELDLPAPERVRVAPDRVVAAATAIVLDAPYLLPLVGDRAVVPAGGAPGPVADLLDLPLAAEIVADQAPAITSTPNRRLAWADVPGAALAAARLDRLEPLAGAVAIHDGLTVAGVRVDWWPAEAAGEDVDHVDATAGAAALGRALAWRCERWSARAALAECFARPDAADVLAAEDGCAD